MGTISSTPADLFSSPREGARSYKVSTLTAFDAATEAGRSLSASVKITIPADGAYSVLIPSNADRVVRFVRAKDLFIEYYNGDATGSIVALSGFATLNNKITNDFSAGVEVYNDHPTGNRVVSAESELNESFYPNGNFCIELSNTTGSPITTFLSIGIEQAGDTVEPFLLTPLTQLEANTEMSDYNGTN